MAISVEKNWKAKAKSDFAKLKTDDFDRYIFVTTQRITSGKSETAFKRDIVRLHPYAANKEICVLGGDWVLSLLSKEPDARIWRHRLGLPHGELPSVLIQEEFLANLERRERGQVPSFVGREKELIEVATSLESNRDVLLIGPSGSGKSRLIAELGHALPKAVFIDSPTSELIAPDFDRLREASAIIVDNAHVHKDELQRIVSARSDARTGVNAPILAVAWPGRADGLATTLVTPRQIDLPKMLGKEIVALVRNIAEFDDDVLALIERLAGGIPGLAVIAARASTQSGIRSLADIEAAAAHHLRSKLPNMASSLIAAAVAVDGDVDRSQADLDRLGNLTGCGRQEVLDALHDLEHDGILCPSRSGGWEIWPELLRRVVVSELMFSRKHATRLPWTVVLDYCKSSLTSIASLLGNLPAIADSETVAGAIKELAQGIDIADPQAIEVAMGFAPREPKLAFDLACAWVSQQSESAISSSALASLITFLVRWEPELGTMLALNAALLDKRIDPPLHQLTEHPLRRAQDEAQHADQFSAGRKAVIADTALDWFKSDPTEERARLVAMLLKSAGEPQIVGVSSVPGDENIIAYKGRFLGADEAVVAMQSVVKAFETVLHQSKSPAAARYALDLIDSLDHAIGGYQGFANTLPSSELPESLKPFRQQLASALRIIFKTHFGVRSRLGENNALELDYFGPIKVAVRPQDRFRWEQLSAQIEHAADELIAWDCERLVEVLHQARSHLRDVASNTWALDTLVSAVGAKHPKALEVSVALENLQDSRDLAWYLHQGIARREELVWPEMQRLVKCGALTEAIGLLFSIPNEILAKQGEDELRELLESMADQCSLREHAVFRIGHLPDGFHALLVKVLLSSQVDTNFALGFSLISQPSDFDDDVIARLHQIPLDAFQDLRDLAHLGLKSFELLARHRPEDYERLFERAAEAPHGIVTSDRREFLKRYGEGLKTLDPDYRTRMIARLIGQSMTASATADTLLRLELEKELVAALCEASLPEARIASVFGGVIWKDDEIDIIQRVVISALDQGVVLAPKTLYRILRPKEWGYADGRSTLSKQIEARTSSLEAESASLKLHTKVIVDQAVKLLLAEASRSPEE